MRVAFKKFEDGDIIAIFPDQRWNKDCTDMLTSYMTQGQHAPCSDSLLRELDDATEEEYIGLKEEIEHLYKERVNVCQGTIRKEVSDDRSKRFRQGDVR